MTGPRTDWTFLRWPWPSRTLTFPWDKGFDPEDEYAYYQDLGFRDWVHPSAGTPLLKAQHPDFEVFQGSVHQAAGAGLCRLPHALPARRERQGHFPLVEQSPAPPGGHVHRMPH
ncbi:MAG: ammonia-forming cytochrome c nitrite reductase subunit c552 [Bacillota bacterium]